VLKKTVTPWRARTIRNLQPIRERFSRTAETPIR
jgi:hypothetical protein